MKHLLLAATVALSPSLSRAQVCDAHFLRDLTINYSKFFCADTKSGAKCFAEVADMVSRAGSYVAWTGLAAVPLSGAAKAAVDNKFLTAKALSSFVASYGSKFAVAGGATFATGLAVAGIGKVAGIVADPIVSGSQSPLGEACTDDHPQFAVALIHAERGSRCKPLVVVRSNPMVARFFSLPSEAARMEVLKQPGACEYYSQISAMVDHKLNQRKIAVYKGPKPASAPDTALTSDEGTIAR